MAPTASLNKLPDLLAAFFAPRCLQRNCQHDHSTRPRVIQVVIEECNIMEDSPSRLVDQARVKAWVRDLDILFLNPGHPDSSIRVYTSAFCTLLANATKSPPTEFLDDIRLGLIRSLVVRPVSREEVPDDYFAWTIGPRKTAGELNEGERKNFASHYAFLERKVGSMFRVEVETVHVQHDRGRITAVYDFDELSEVLYLTKSYGD